MTVTGDGTVRRDLPLLLALLRWAPAAIGVETAAGIVLGLFAMTRDSAEVRLGGAVLVLAQLVFAMSALLAVLLLRVLVARWAQSTPPPGPWHP